MKVVLVSQNITFVKNRAEYQDVLDQRFTKFLQKANLTPLYVPNTLSQNNTLRELLSRVEPEGIVLSGGCNVNEFSKRDLTEKDLLDHAKLRKLPVLGICRGMQFMASYCGAKLKKVDNHLKVRHRISGEISGEVNSYHRFALQNCPLGFSVISKSQDGEIEAIKNTALKWEGWMWHPEREETLNVQDLNRVKRLFN